MRNIILLVVALLYSCGFPQEQRNSNNGNLSHQVESDSITLVAYKYKKQGNDKFENGDKQGAIDDYTQAIMIKPSYDTAYYNRGVVKANLGRNKNMGTTLKEQMASYTSKPVYYVEYSSRGCLVDIRINDSRVQKDYNPGEVGNAVITANTAILKSGKQRVTVRLIPYRDETLITEKEPFTLRIGYKDLMEPSGDEGRPWHWVMEMPPIVMPEEGLPYYEWSGEFEAKVPYQVVGWSDCIDLREIPDIEQRVVAKFKEFRQLYIDGKYDELKRLQHPKYYELAIMLYENENDIEEKHMSNVADGESQDKSGYQPIEDYNLVFYADGRLVTLEKYDKEFDYFHNSALLWYAKKNEDGTAYANSYMLQFGIREGTNELVLIR